MTLDDAIAALRQAGQVVQQHNLLSTASDEERRDTIARHIAWWNDVALPVLEAYESIVYEEDSDEWKCDAATGVPALRAQSQAELLAATFGKDEKKEGAS